MVRSQSNQDNYTKYKVLKTRKWLLYNSPKITNSVENLCSILKKHWVKNDIINAFQLMEKVIE